MGGFFMPVYSFKGNKFVVMGNRCYDTEQEAIDAGLPDGITMLMEADVSLVPEAYHIPLKEEDAQWILNSRLITDIGSVYEVAIFAGPEYDAEDFGED